MNLITSLLYRLRILGWLEGSSLLILLFIAVPIKHVFGYARLVQFIGPVHGVFFLLYVITVIQVGIERQWSLRLQGKLLLACLLPFGTFYIDRTVLSKVKSIE